MDTHLLQDRSIVILPKLLRRVLACIAHKNLLATWMIIEEAAQVIDAIVDNNEQIVLLVVRLDVV